jgi:hypothetical protein
MVVKRLSHSGIKGQRKGIRRFQYANGTYTKAGNERYRPSKGIKLGALGMMALIEANTGIGRSIVNGILGSIGGASVGSVGAGLISLGATVVSAIPPVFWAVSLPIAAISIGSAITSQINNPNKGYNPFVNRQQYFKDRKYGY